MKRICAVFLVVVLACGCLVGCSDYDYLNEESSSSKAESSEQSSKNATPVYNINWDKCIEDTKASIADPNFYDYLKDVHIEVEEAEKQITFSAVLSDSTSADVALDYADTMVRQFNLFAQMQDSSIKSSSKDYYGGVYDSYSALVGVAPLSKVKNSDEWYVYDAIAKGGKNKLKLSKAYQ